MIKDETASQEIKHPLSLWINKNNAIPQLYQQNFALAVSHPTQLNQQNFAPAIFDSIQLNQHNFAPAVSHPTQLNQQIFAPAVDVSFLITKMMLSQKTFNTTAPWKNYFFIIFKNES
ncbi:unnamed protein product [Blepharisma stoltei]|uniref:Uncharacterized protein n=1 Tax=Blepharisma stoltei TaxID=1481888 RepID=A0AAU9ILU7_9CILI|nr:unnamed protein product [Blepharisma stoltei]